MFLSGAASLIEWANMSAGLQAIVTYACIGAACLAVAAPHPDWLIRPVKTPASVKLDQARHIVTLSNGLISREILLAPNAATVSFECLSTREQFVRAVGPEATITVDGTQVAIGGLTGQPDQAFLLPQWYSQLKALPNSLQFTGYDVGKIETPFAWETARQSQGKWGGAGLPWPPKGVSLTLHFAGSTGVAAGLRADVRYEIYDGVPVLMKQLTVQNVTNKTVRLDAWTVERLALAENQSAVGDMREWRKPDMFIASDYSFAGDNAENANQVAHVVPDSSYTTQVNYNLTTPCLLECRPPIGPGVYLKPGEGVTSFRVYELPYDSTIRERRGLEERAFYRRFAPWSQENPIMLHLVASDEKSVKEAVDQCSAAGFEMLILSFGSGLNMEDVSPANIAKFKALADYAHSKGIAIGGYSLLASRSIDAADDVIDPKTGKPGGAVFGSSPCLGSKWGIGYLEHIKMFLKETGFDLLENDGSYPGDICASTTHPGHHDLEDSQWTQWKQITDFYEWCRGQGIYLNVPDWYFLAGSNKTGMGYRETNWSLPRDLQHLHNRENLYDGTWEKTPSMGWSFVPLTQYHGGGEAATIEPLKDHLDSYGQFLAENFGYGVQACWRGKRIYDSPQTLALVKKWVEWFKAHRAILQSDVIHLGRPDGRQPDAVLHCSPNLDERGLLMVFNPTEAEVSETITVPLYYSGLTDSCRVFDQFGKVRTLKLDADGNAQLRIKIPPKGHVWFVFKRS